MIRLVLKNIGCRIKYRKYLCQQQESSDCGIACLNSILKHYHLETSMEHLRNISGTTHHGTSILGLCQAADNFGITMTAFRLQAAAIEKIEALDILLVPARKRDKHYILILEKIKDHFVVMDPLHGIILYKSSELARIWQTGIVLKIQQVAAVPYKPGKKKLVEYIWLNTLLKERTLLFISSFLLTLLVVVLNISTFLFLKILIDRSFTQDKNEDVFFICGIMLFSLLLKSVLTYFKAKVNNIVLNDVHISIASYFTRLFFRLPKSFFASRKTGELVARYNDSAKIQESLSYFLNESLQHGLIVMLSLGFIFIFSWKIGMAVALFIPVLYGISMLFWKNIIKLQMGVMSANVQKTGAFINMVQGIDAIKMAGKEYLFSRLNMQFFKNYQQNNFDKANLNASLFFTADVAIALILFIILLMSSQAILNKELLIGELIAIFSLFLSLTPSIIALPFTGFHLQNYKVAVNRINDLNYLLDKKNDTGTPFTTFSTVSFNHVDFSYPGCKKVIHNLNFIIKKNEFVCFIGESGIGKTTLINLIIGFYQPTSGEIRIDSKPLPSVRLQDWQNRIGLVEQNVPIFNGSIAFNISLNPALSTEGIIEFCQQNGFHDFFSRLPDRYDTPLGDYGIELSNGQKQLIGIARALYSNPEILILDEPSSALDYQTEKSMYNIIMRHKHKLTIILITHKFNITYLSDVIYIIEDGRIERKGTHNELLETENFYSRFCQFLSRNPPPSKY